MPLRTRSQNEKGGPDQSRWRLSFFSHPLAGDHLFEPCHFCTYFPWKHIFQVSKRSAFSNPVSNDVQEWREYVCLTARNSEEARNHFTGNDDDWEKTWDKLSQKGKYEYEAGDLIIPALAHCTNAPIMIVNADSKVAPFYFVSETVWGGEVSNNPPIILVHDGAHYENLLPETEEDEEITRDVFQFWKTNDFNISRRDISNAKIEARKMSGKETEKRTWAEVAKSNIAAKITEQIFEDQAGTKKRDYEQRKEEKEAARRREKQREEESYKIEGERDELKKREEKKRSLRPWVRL